MLSLVTTLLAQLEPATATQHGYVTTATQEFGGFKYFTAGVCSMEDAYFNGAARAYPGKQLRLLGARPWGDEVAAVVIANDLRRDGGSILDVRRGPDIKDRVLVVDGETGNVIAACESDATTRTCSFVDGSGISGHVSMTTMPGYHLVLQGRLSENHKNTLLDGGCNMTEADGGCYAAFAAPHGELTITSSEPRPHGGLYLEVINPVTDGTGKTRFFVDAWGGIAQRHNMIRAQFPRCPVDGEATTPQTQAYFNGAVESTQLYAFDEHRWHYCDGTQWVHSDDRSGCE